MRTTLRGAVENANDQLETALSQNVRTIGFGGYDAMLEARQTLLDAGVTPAEHVPVREVLTAEQAASYALHLLNKAKRRKETETRYAGYDTMLAARRALYSAVDGTVSPVSLVGSGTVAPTGCRG